MTRGNTMTGSEAWNIIGRFLPIETEEYRSAYIIVYQALKEYDERRGNDD